MDRSTREHARRRHRRVAVAAALALGALLAPVRLAAGPLDAEDKAKVSEIDGKVSTALDTATDVRKDADELIIIGAEEAIGLDNLTKYNQAQLRFDLERLMIETCAGKCLKPPLPPAQPSSATSCWSCISPRVLITRANGGYLDDVMDLVKLDIDQVEQAGLDLELDLARTLFALAQQSLQAGDTEEAFTNACQSFGVLACDRPMKLRGVALAGRRIR